MIELYVISLVILVILSACFSGAETALMSVGTIKVATLVNQNKKGAKTLQELKSNPFRLLIAILIGNNIVNILAAALATVLFTELFGDAGIGVATGVMTFFVLVFGEITPKTIATQHAVKISLRIAKPVLIMIKILSPIIIFFEAIARGISKLAGAKETKTLSQAELRAIVTMGAKEGVIDKDTAEMMHNLIEFHETVAMDIMTPKALMLTLDGNKTVSELLDYVVKTPYSKYPVFSGTEDNIIGIADVDDILAAVREKKDKMKIKDLANPAIFVPTMKEIDDLLSDFAKNKQEIAIVVNEYGGIAGLVTMEDILEEIVGEIFDKSRPVSPYIIEKKGKYVIVNARASINEINKVFKLSINEENFSTLAGFIESELQKVPKKGEQVILKNIIFEVDQVTHKEIKTVKVFRK
ncbi:MAG: HlyC/CorC family transporter [Candidatus Diapherotrites archaeon]|nr:HlyC/CorC family transporter [Candidatus Diapherotrites archaeon]